ncbi:MAG: FixH family protein [Flavobacteriales bacterium]|nr:FixH family protein [Flavobacteriales bacterium]MCX7649092.1 FixH family protein [Flavobacteriales bacterium]MDW8431602.1 FixH family protein [Flavobacteriales bacterium]
MDHISKKSFRLGWGWGITFGIAGFMSFILAMVTISMRQKDIHLQADNYYEQQLSYQSVIDQKRKASLLPGLPSIKADPVSGVLVLDFSHTQQQDVHGRLSLFRPSDPSLDQDYEIHLDSSGQQILQLEKYRYGKWLCKIAWTHRGEAYYTEFSLLF